MTASAPPLETEADARALPAVAAILKGNPASYADGSRAMMSGALAAAGVKIGAYEARILLMWLPQFEPAMVAAVAGVLRRAHLTGLAAAKTGEGDGDA